MNIRKTLLSGMLASSMALSGGIALAQDMGSSDATPANDASATPVASLTSLEDVPVVNADGEEIAQADVWVGEDGEEGVWFKITGENSGLEEGKYGVHIHETGICDADAMFDSAGGHFNPTDETHGDINSDPSHGGDLGNIEVDGDGNFEHEVLAEKVSMDPEEMNSLADDDGSAIVIHAGEDDLETDPSGESGDREACGVIFPPMDGAGTPAATPVD